MTQLRFVRETAWLGSPNNDNQVVAAVFYGAAATIGAIIFNLLWWYGAYAARLTSPELSVRQRRSHTIAWGLAPVLTTVLTMVAFVSPVLAVAGFLATVFIYVLPLPRLLARGQLRRRTESSATGRRAR
jgi:chromate transport protein ChrA